MRVAFYAPLKAPEHPVPSGDRTMGRALVKALALAGHEVIRPSSLRSFLPAPDARRQAEIADTARRDIDAVALNWVDIGPPPDVWLTYHNHYKAPDLLGPELAHRFGLPYGVVEASHAPKRAAAWTSWHAAAERAIQAADLHVCFTARDRDGIAGLLKPGSVVIDLPPFLDTDDHDGSSGSERGHDVPQLVTLAMMRPGDKLASYSLLAQSLDLLRDHPWHLHIIGDGPVRPAVQALFATLPAARITWHGALAHAAAWRQVGQADLFVWPGFGEAFGLAYLEAQAAGVPVLALDTAGVSAVVRHGVTGLLVRDPSPTSYAEALRGLMSDRAAQTCMGAAARHFVLGERTLDQASATLDRALRDCLQRKVFRHG